MPKTVTLRLEDPVYREFRELAAEDRRPLSNWIVATTLRHLEECQFVDEVEMAAIRADRGLVQRLRQGSRDARMRRGRLVG